MTPSPAPTRQSSPAGGASSVEFRNVTKRYSPGGPPAVDGISFYVPAGSICILVGPSGCGKTTTLRMVNRLVEPTSGQILLDGQDITTEDRVELRRRIGYVIQQTGLFPHLTVAQNVGVVPALLHWPKARRETRVSELLALVGLDPGVYGARYPHELSGGERQRVGVARALGADPPLLLMDEPFGAVDPIARARLQDELLRLQHEIAKTILFVTHDVDEAIKLGDLVAVFQTGGHLAQIGSPDAILARPASDFVARFVGEDRGLKRLALVSVADVPLEAGSADVIPGDGIPRLPASMSLRDALSTLLAANASEGLALDGENRPRGRLSVEAITAAVRAEPAAVV